MISQEKIAEIRNRASIVEVISDYVTLKRAGRNHLGLCPFHSEKTPSFTVSEEKGIYHCFGCHAGGGVFHFLMQYERLSFPEAVERVAKRYGIAVEHTGAARDLGEREKLYRINERVADNYQRILLTHPEGKKALTYLQSRGLDEATAKKFMLGYAPQNGSGLLGVLKRENASLGDALRLGLVGQRGPRQYYEKFFARVIFPIMNPAGKVVAFGGRVLNDALPKYLNSSETPLFHKGATLYGLYQAREAIRSADRALIVEGYLDVIALFQHGVSYAVATLGTALTPEHLRLLSRYTKNIIALFDGDNAGRKAAARSFEIFVEAGLFGRAAFLPKGEDPDSFVRSRGKAAVEQVIDQATPLADYYFSWLQEQHGTTLEGKSRIAAEINRLLTKVSNPLEADLLARRAVDLLGIREELLRKSVAAPQARPGVASSRTVAPASGEAQRHDVAERSLLSAALKTPSVLEPLVHEPEARHWFDPKWQPVVDALVAAWQERGNNVNVAELSQSLPEEMASELAALALAGENLSDPQCAKIAADCLAHLRRKYLRERERALRLAIRAAEEKQDENAKRERILEWQDLVRRKRQLDRRKLEAKRVIP